MGGAPLWARLLQLLAESGAGGGAFDFDEDEDEDYDEEDDEDDYADENSVPYSSYGDEYGYDLDGVLKYRPFY